MKNLKVFIAIIAMSLATTFSATANEKEPSKINKTLRTELVAMLGDKINLEVNTTDSSKISFMINNKNEVVVISVATKVDGFQSLVKSKLNYKKINVKGIKKGEVYILPVTLKTT
jgi:alkyl hydroperoxide reductase subunit AhpF